MCPHKVSLTIKFEGSSWKKLTSGMPKMPMSDDQPLCAYLMRYDAHIQSHPRASPKWCIYQKNLNLVKRIEVIIQTPTADGRMDGRTEGQMDGRTEWIQYTPPQLRCGGYNEPILLKIHHILWHQQSVDQQNIDLWNILPYTTVTYISAVCIQRTLVAVEDGCQVDNTDA